MGAELHRGASWLGARAELTVDNVIELPAEAMAEADLVFLREPEPEPEREPEAVLRRKRLFTASTERRIGTGEPESEPRPLGGSKRRRFLRRR